LQAPAPERVKRIAILIWQRAVRPLERMNSTLERRKVRLRGLGGPAAAASQAPARPQPGDHRIRSAILQSRGWSLHAARPALERFVVRTGARIYFVPVGEVDWIEAEGNYVRLHAGARTHLLRASVTSIAERLDPRVFLRIHRSTILNLGRLREVHPFGKGTYVVVLDDGAQLTSSITYRAGIEALISG
jgi:two-component system, LytTR family, response regulator